MLALTSPARSFLDPKDANALEYKLESFSSVRPRRVQVHLSSLTAEQIYRRLTGKEVVFTFGDSA